MASSLIFLSEVGVASINAREECMISVLVSPSEAGMALDQGRGHGFCSCYSY